MFGFMIGILSLQHLLCLCPASSVIFSLFFHLKNHGGQVSGGHAPAPPAPSAATRAMGFMAQLQRRADGNLCRAGLWPKCPVRTFQVWGCSGIDQWEEDLDGGHQASNFNSWRWLCYELAVCRAHVASLAIYYYVIYWSFFTCLALKIEVQAGPSSLEFHALTMSTRVCLKIPFSYDRLKREKMGMMFCSWWNGVP